MKNILTYISQMPRLALVSDTPGDVGAEVGNRVADTQCLAPPLLQAGS